MKRNVFGLSLLLSTMALSALVACSNKKDDAKTTPDATPAGAGPHASNECPEGVEGFYKNNSQARDSFRYFSVHKSETGVLIFNQSPSAKRDENTDLPVNGQKKSFPENKEYAAACSGKAIRIESFRDGVKVSWTMISFADNKAKVEINIVNFLDGKPSSMTVLPYEFEKSNLPPERAEEPVTPGLDKNGCPNDIVGKYASREEAMYLKFSRNEAGTLLLAASTFTAEYPAVELNNAPKPDGDGGTLTGECANGVISVIGVSGNGDVSTMQVKKASDKTLDVKKLKNGKTVKSDTYDKIR